ncbi:hypothetical protein C8D88_10479 [Lentzea atacamensis]|uniref:Uncharacterized protein n=1 Tax=Lentzea atacamensis TaxID=531938 RepID=A0A316I358_9PSEU|nr:hypothetical protein C8D88_10479 [Lentzea atacamensis]
MKPASTAMAIEVHSVAFGLNRCAAPNNKPVSASETHVPRCCSTMRNRMPRKISSSTTTATAMKPNNAEAPASEPGPRTS